MVDVSLSGLGYTVDARKNSGVYGAEATPARILDGGVAPPPAMQTLYAALDKVGRGPWGAGPSLGRAACCMHGARYMHA